MKEYADRIVGFDGSRFDFDPANLYPVKGRWEQKAKNEKLRKLKRG